MVKPKPSTSAILMTLTFQDNRYVLISNERLLTHSLTLPGLNRFKNPTKKKFQYIWVPPCYWVYWSKSRGATRSILFMDEMFRTTPNGSELLNWTLDCTNLGRIQPQHHGGLHSCGIVFNTIFRTQNLFELSFLFGVEISMQSLGNEQLQLKWLIDIYIR